MGFKKHRHSKDKLYIRAVEWEQEFGGYKKAQSLRQFKRLPYDSCCISLAPFENPMVDAAGNCFELLNVVPWLKQYGTNPVTGKKMKATDLIKMTWYKNADKKYHCPVSIFLLIFLKNYFRNLGAISRIHRQLTYRSEHGDWQCLLDGGDRGAVLQEQEHERLDQR